MPEEKIQISKETLKETRKNTEKIDPTMFEEKKRIQQLVVIGGGTKTWCADYFLSLIITVQLKTWAWFKDIERFNCSFYMFFRKLSWREMKPSYNYCIFNSLGYREYVMRVLFFGWMQYWLLIYLLVATCFDFV